MIYQKTITTPANTAKSVELRTVFPVVNGLVYQFELQFPPGPLGLTFVRVKDGGHQVWPTEDGEYFRGDNLIVSFEDLYLKLHPPFKFDVLTYNLDDTYDHDVILRLGVVSKDVYLARFLPHLGYREFVNMLNDLSKQQEEALQAKNETIINHPLSWIDKQGEK